MMNRPPLSPRQLAGKQNRLKRLGLTAEGRQRLSEAARRYQPWLHSTGPKTAAGKARSATNGKARQTGALSVREARALTMGAYDQVEAMVELRRALGDMVK